MFLPIPDLHVLTWRHGVKMGTANSLHASAKYGEYNESFGLEFVRLSCGRVTNKLVTNWQNFAQVKLS